MTYAIKTPLSILPKFSKKIISILVLVSITQIAFAQQRLKGFQVTFDDYGKHVYKTTYLRTTLANQGNFITTYKVYDLKGKLIVKVEATHRKNEKKILVDVTNPNGGIFKKINTEEGEYETPSLEPFGNQGNYRLLGGNDYPPQLSMQFLSNKYESVKVISVNGTKPSSQTFVFYVFAKELEEH